MEVESREMLPDSYGRRVRRQGHPLETYHVIGALILRLHMFAFRVTPTGNTYLE